jgi:XapX domain-containing protein
LLSLGADVPVGVAYSPMGVRSPASPIVGLLGVLIGEQVLPLGKTTAKRPGVESR